MWLFFGIFAIIFTGFNLTYSFKNRNIFSDRSLLSAVISMV